MRVEQTYGLAKVVGEEARVHNVDELEVRRSLVRCVLVNLQLDCQLLGCQLRRLSVASYYVELPV